MAPVIFSFWEYAFKCLALYALLGVIWYIADRKVGVSIYRWFYNMFHRNPMPATEERGFMYNQRTYRKSTVAFVISTVQSAYMLFGAPKIDLLVELVMWVAEVPAMLLGFWAGAWVYQHLFLRRRELADTIDAVGDRLEQVHVKDVQQGAQWIGQRVIDSLASLPAMLFSRKKQVVEPPVIQDALPPKVASEAPVLVPEAPSKVDPQEALRKYIRRGG